MPVTKQPSLPFKPSPDASILELNACLGDAIEWALSQRLGQLKDAGLSDADLMRLRRVAVNYQKGRAGLKDTRVIWELMPMLEHVHVTKPADS